MAKDHISIIKTLNDNEGLRAKRKCDVLPSLAEGCNYKVAKIR